MTRVPSKVETELRSEGHTLALGKTADISLKGLYVASQQSLPTVTACHVTLRLGPQKRPIRIALEGDCVHS